jgi:hypothetical protein
MSIPEVAAFYRRSVHVVWRQSTAGNATLLGAAWQGFFLTVELRAESPLRTAVRTSLAAPVRAPLSLDRWPLPPDTQLLSRSGSRDGCHRGEVMVFRNLHSLDANSDYLVQALHGAGYRIESRYPVRGQALRGELLRLAAPGKQCEIALTDSDGWRWIRVVTTVDAE